MGENYYFAVLFPHCSFDVCFLCFVVCFVHHEVLYCVCRCVRPAERRALLGLGILFSRSVISCFFFLFVWKYFISAFLFSSCLSLLSFLFAVFPVFRFYQYARMVVLFLSDFFLVCSIPTLSTPSFFLNIISLYKHWCLNFICFLIIICKNIKKYLFAYM